jgi:conjugal transfer pilus assembly protein TraK
MKRQGKGVYVKRLPGITGSALAITLILTAAAFAQPPEGAKVVYPEVASLIKLSSTDVNRFVCADRIKDVVYSKEKGINVRYSGKDAFVKFLIELKNGEKQYVAGPTELFIVCGEDTYNVIAAPDRNVPSQTVYLSSGQQASIKKNLALFAGMPYEEKILSILKDVYTNALPESFDVARVNKPFDLFRDVSLTLVRVVEVGGEGLRVKEYSAVLKNQPMGAVALKEKDFLLKELAQNPAGIAIDKHNLKVGDIARILVVERTEDGGN